MYTWFRPSIYVLCKKEREIVMRDIFSVHTENEGGIVNEESNVVSSEDTSRKGHILKAEKAVLEHLGGIVLRLAGLYTLWAIFDTIRVQSESLRLYRDMRPNLKKILWALAFSFLGRGILRIFFLEKVESILFCWSKPEQNFEFGLFVLYYFVLYQIRLHDHHRS